MKIGDVIFFQPLSSETKLRGKIIWMDTANVAGKKKTIYEVEVKKHDVRLISQKQICK